MNLQGKKVLVLGLGASGIAAALKLRESGALVSANDAGSGETPARRGARPRSARRRSACWDRIPWRCLRAWTCWW